VPFYKGAGIEDVEVELVEAEVTSLAFARAEVEREVEPLGWRYAYVKAPSVNEALLPLLSHPLLAARER
jgi:hypothetical protein